MTDDKRKTGQKREERSGPTESQIDAAIEGLTPGHGNEFGIRGEIGPGQGRTGRSGSGTPGGGGGLGTQSSSAGPGEQPADPSAETGGPRGAGTAASPTSGGRTPDGQVVRDPKESIRERTSRPVEERRRAAGDDDEGAD